MDNITEEKLEKYVRKAKANYQKEYRQRNKEKAEQAQRRYWEKKAMELIEEEQAN